MGTVEVNGISLSYATSGDGLPVVLVCGATQAAASWSLYQVPSLVATGHRVITFDNRGMPPSDCPAGPYTISRLTEDLAAVIEAVANPPVPVVGYSLGSIITQELALSRPDLVSQIVLMGTLGRQDTFRRALLQSWIDLDETELELPHRYDAVIGAIGGLAPATLDDRDAIQRYLDLMLTMPAPPRRGRLAQHQALLDYDDRLDALSSITAPALVIGFEHDLITPALLCREVAAALPNSRYEQVSNAGHFGPFERPEEVNLLLTKFLRRPANK